MSLAEPDLLDHLVADTMRNPSSESIKTECLRAIQAVFDRDGSVDANRVRQERAEWARKNNRAGAVMTALVKAGAAVPTGDTAFLGSSEHRAARHRTEVYRLTRQVWPEVAA